MAAQQNESQLGSNSPARPSDPIDLDRSVAGEEDPGASLDVPTGTEGRSEAPAGTSGTGESVCPQCGGSGKQGASSCPNCQGTGKVIVGIGGA